MAKAKLDTGVILDVKQHIILKNFWEFYITEMPDQDGIGFAFVQGFENELGSFSIHEINPYILTVKDGKDISTDPESEDYVMPPEGGEWIS